MNRKLFFIGVSFLVLCGEIRAGQPYECIIPGTEMYYTIHNKRGKITDCLRVVVTGAENRDSCLVVSQLEYPLDKNWNPMMDNKGFTIGPDSIEFVVLGEGFSCDISKFVDNRGEPLDDKTVKYIEGGGYEYIFRRSGSPDFIYPDRMIVGDTLCRYHSEDGWKKVATGKSALGTSSLDIVIYVAAKEKVRTAAGEFDCYKIIAETEYRIEFPLYNPVERHRMVEWVACGIGAVKLGEEDKKGRLGDYMELVRIEWPAGEKPAM
jgi:hypothetical protein